MSTPVLTLAQICKEKMSQINHTSTYFFPPEGHFANSSPTSSPNMHSILHYLAKNLIHTQSIQDSLQELALLLTQMLQIDLCLFLLNEHEQDLFTLAACQPDLHPYGILLQTLHPSTALLTKLKQAAFALETPYLHESELDLLDPLKNVEYKTLLPIPLVSGEICLGLLNCYSSQPRVYHEDELLLLYTVAGQCALMLKNRLGLEELAQTQRTHTKAFFADLFSAQPGMEDPLRRRAYALGFDTTRPHIVVQLECSGLSSATPSHCESVLKQIVQRIQHHYPSSLIDEGSSSISALLCLDGYVDLKQIQAWFAMIIAQLREEQQICLSVGLSNPCTALLDYKKASLEASEALQIGAALSAQGSCQAFQDLGAYRYLYQFARAESLPDLYQEQLEALVAYDQRKKTNLLDTLESFLESGSNAAKTSILLAVHRNTLLQRLERIQKLCTLDLEQVSHRLPLLLAIKVYRLRTHEAQSSTFCIPG